MVASRDQALADLLPVAEKARHDCVCSLALMGDRGQGVFMNTCGLVPDCILGPKMPPTLLQRRLLDWLNFRSSRHQSGWLRGHLPEVLSPREREVLRLALSGVPVPVASEDLGITPKTFYTLRMRALNRLGLKNIRALLANHVTGVPDPTSRYNHLLGDYSRQTVFY
ncbi:helix-turn-helix transcriptional regulator (plasmid) [Salmonella enterica subsp. salamae]|nr:LuxR family transcriptional regulator [Salmonella enterica]EBP3975395.1 helix-turn-helix transcriptional regulator [Salmonella enterica subsp. enterica]ECC9460483.1 LuxR family transcriptional regulator [Salmonella enterica subsp. salamae]ECG1463254.1 LuxR family transcriptional regulator [Salmonella enterica subsp. salamae]ECO4668201.1 helix-turn-helix transcriptional regulator [Salmonella enterica]